MDRSAARERVIVWTSVLALAALAWAYVSHLSFDMDPMGTAASGSSAHAVMMGMTQPHVTPWQPVDVLLTFVMWSVMMVAMMTPTAAPMLVTYTGLMRGRVASHARVTPTALFLAGYLIVWSGFSAAATLLQWTLHTAGLLATGLVTATPALGGTLLVAAGVYQLTPLKDVCLSRCRSPIDFLMTTWRDGTSGALRMGAHHGLYCVGCCWPLMLVLFVAGVMNLLWVAAIALYVLVEKAVPGGRHLSRPVGVLLLLRGGWLLVRAATGDAPM